ncbi:MAG: cyclic nucleotide-binding domain-containing protein [Myxococcota bacterium]|nr:cyclic nucleotide-binding domain-containing protein [Myxococcota bacterium]
MGTSLDFDFVDDDSGGRFVAVGGSFQQVRQLVAKGEIDTAVRVYEDSGGNIREDLIQEAVSASFETRKAIAQMFRRSRDFAAAAKVYQEARLEADAADCFEQAGAFPAAAASYAKSGDLLKAAAAYERAGDPDRAIQLFREAGATERLAECLARSNRFTEAAQEFRILKKTHAEVETLRAGLTAEPENLEIVIRYVELLNQHGRKDQAGALLVTTAKRVAAARDHAPFLTLLASALETMGNAPGAAKIHARLQELPKGHRPAATPTAPAPAAPSPEPGPAGTPGAASDLGADAYGFLKALPMFADLALPDMKALYRICVLQTFAPGQHLIETGQPGKGLFVIVGGQVEVYGGSDASARLLNTLGVGAYVGEISLLQDGPTSARVTARTPVKALFISRDAFLHYLYGSPHAALRIYRLFTLNLADRVRALSAAR